jgi:hypothetical protein
MDQSTYPEQQRINKPNDAVVSATEAKKIKLDQDGNDDKLKV